MEIFQNNAESQEAKAFAQEVASLTFSKPSQEDLEYAMSEWQAFCKRDFADICRFFDGRVVLMDGAIGPFADCFGLLFDERTPVRISDRNGEFEIRSEARCTAVSLVTEQGVSAFAGAFGFIPDNALACSSRMRRLLHSNPAYLEPPRFAMKQGWCDGFESPPRH